MSRSEHPLIWYYEQDRSFAELMNGWIFRGRDFLNADNFTADDRLLQVVTLVLYCGKRHWDGAKRLHELLELDGIPQELLEYVADYRIHVLDVCHTPDRRLREFPPELCAMFLFIKYREQPQELMRKLAGMEIEEDTLEAVADYVGERRLKQFQPERKGGTVNMCKAIDVLIADGEKKGEKRGEKRGFRRGVAQERKKTEQERKRADRAEARVRELERMLAP